MPPFGRLAAIIISSEDKDDAEATARRIARAAPEVEGMAVFGPAPAPLAMLRLTTPAAVPSPRPTVLMMTTDRLDISPLVVSELFAQRRFASLRSVTMTMQPSAFDAWRAASTMS